MICPHCSRNLLRKERTGGRCTHCRREFVFDPKTNPLGLHDLRVEKLAGTLSGEGNLRYTTAQLWFACARKTVTAPYAPLNGLGCALVLLTTVATVVTTITIGGGAAVVVGGVLVAAVVVGAAMLLLNTVVRPAMRRNHRISVPIPHATFTVQVRRDWLRAHGKPLAHMVSDAPLTVPPPARPRAAVVCPDPSVLSCLLANGVSRRHDLLVLRSHRDVPPGLPAILLHDASVDGLRFAAAARAALHPAPMVDAGLSPRQVLGKEKILRLRGRDTAPEGLGLAEREAEWLADGWWAPIAAVAPAKLLAVVDRAVGQLDPAQREAAAVGFLTWPGERRGG